MKKYITNQQWNELNDKEKKELVKYFNNNENETEFIELSIGQMIEFLFEKEWSGFSWESSSAQLTISTNLANDLWEVVKSILKSAQ